MPKFGLDYRRQSKKRKALRKSATPKCSNFCQLSKRNVLAFRLTSKEKRKKDKISSISLTPVLRKAKERMPFFPPTIRFSEIPLLSSYAYRFILSFSLSPPFIHLTPGRESMPHVKLEVRLPRLQSLENADSADSECLRANRHRSIAITPKLLLLLLLPHSRKRNQLRSWLTLIFR